jgi:hypothetical protein
MDYQPFIQAATPIVLTFATTVAGLAWNEFRKSAKFQQLGWVQRTMADVIANAVAHTYATKVRQWKESAPDGKLTAPQKTAAEDVAMRLAEEAARSAGVPEAQIPAPAVLRGAVVNAVAAAKAKAKPAVHTGPTTKGA